MNRSERRRIDRKLKQVAGQDSCSFCGQKFPHNSRIIAGVTADDEAVIACEQQQCIRGIKKIYAFGLQTHRKYDLFGKGSGDSSKSVAPANALTALNMAQQVISNADEKFDDGLRRSGVKQQQNQTYNLLDSAWKDDDRAWFEQNPTRTHRARSLYPDEYGRPIPAPPAGHEVLVLVRQIEPGLRVKRSFYINQQKLPVPDSEAIVHALFDIVDEGTGSGEPIDDEKLGMLIDRYRAADEHS